MIYFTADFHFWHTNIIKFCSRPFKDTEEMNRVLIDNYNSTITDQDTVYILGDFSMASFSWQRSLLNKMNGKKILVRGNHDRSTKQCLEMGFESVTNGPLDIEYKNIKFRLSHYPFAPSVPTDYPVKFLDRRPKREGCDWLLCGHCHVSWKTLENMINIGVDQWSFRPVSFDEIVGYVGNLQQKNTDFNLLSDQHSY